MFKYNSAIEKHKVFISGLPFSCTKPQLEELCKSHGTVKDVRLVTYRSGKPKVRKPLGGRPKCLNHVFWLHCSSDIIGYNWVNTCWREKTSYAEMFLNC